MSHLDELIKHASFFHQPTHLLGLVFFFNYFFFTFLFLYRELNCSICCLQHLYCLVQGGKLSLYDFKYLFFLLCIYMCLFSLPPRDKISVILLGSFFPSLIQKSDIFSLTGVIGEEMV